MKASDRINQVVDATSLKKNPDETVLNFPPWCHHLTNLSSFQSNRTAAVGLGYAAEVWTVECDTSLLRDSGYCCLLRGFGTWAGHSRKTGKWDIFPCSTPAACWNALLSDQLRAGLLSEGLQPPWLWRGTRKYSVSFIPLPRLSTAHEVQPEHPTR